LSELCNRILATDKRVIFAMIVDEQGRIHCEKTRTGEKYSMPRDIVLKVGGVWASVVGGVFRQLSQFHGPFEYAIIKNEKLTTIGMGGKKGYVIFTTKEENPQQLIEKIRKELM